MISFNILFWDNGDSERIENVNYVFNSFKNQINDKYILNLFDFSEKIVIKNSIHIPYPKDYFLKSKKINDVLKFNKQLNCDFICLIDSDIFPLLSSALGSGTSELKRSDERASITKDFEFFKLS